MSKLKLFAVALTVATLIPAASASALPMSANGLPPRPTPFTSP